MCNATPILNLLPPQGEHSAHELPHVPEVHEGDGGQREDTANETARAGSPSETPPRLRFWRDLRSARGRSSLSDSAVGDAGSGGWSSSESSGIRTTRFFLLDDIAGGAGPPSPMSLRLQREIDSLHSSSFSPFHPLL